MSTATVFDGMVAAIDNDNINPSFDGIDVVSHVEQKVEWIRQMFRKDHIAQLWVNLQDGGVAYICAIGIREKDEHLLITGSVDGRNLPIDITYTTIYGRVNGISVDFYDAEDIA